MEQYKFEAHSFTKKVRGSAYMFCSKCGTVMMKNDFSLWWQRMGCNAQDHPNYSNERSKTSPFKEF